MTNHKGIVIADIHSVVVDIPSYENEMGFLLENIRSIKDLDFIVICGDYFDKKMYLNDKKAEWAIKYLREIIEIGIDKKIKLRVVYGTRSHEEDQYKILYSYSCEYVRFIEKVESEALFDDLFVLYIPEEFVENKVEYYKEYLYDGVQYDYIFGHGVIRDVMKKAANNIEASNRYKKVPTFNYGELSNNCSGYTYFGHYHVRTNLHDKVFYVGSYDRLAFDDGDTGLPKGFYVTEVNDKEYSHTFYINPYAKKFTTITYEKTNSIYSDNERLSSQITKLKKIVDNNEYDKIRLIFHLPENSDGIVESVKKLIGKDTRLKAQFIKPSEKNSIIDNSDSEDDSTDYLFDDSLLISEKVKRYIYEKYSIDIPTDIIIEYCTIAKR